MNRYQKIKLHFGFECVGPVLPASMEFPSIISFSCPRSQSRFDLSFILCIPEPISLRCPFSIYRFPACFFWYWGVLASCLCFHKWLLPTKSFKERRSSTLVNPALSCCLFTLSQSSLESNWQQDYFGMPRHFLQFHNITSLISALFSYNESLSSLSPSVV